LLPAPADIDEPDELAEAVAEQLLCRWGVVFRDLAVREGLALPWREIQWALRRLEARGTIRGGRFVTGFSGEQYALPEAVEALAALRRETSRGDDDVVTINAADPLNLTGVLTPGRRVPAVAARTLTYVDGLPVDSPAGGHDEHDEDDDGDAEDDDAGGSDGVRGTTANSPARSMEQRVIFATAPTPPP
jgi:ATP-dependent Lhr-like helicase